MSKTTLRQRYSIAFRTALSTVAFAGLALVVSPPAAADPAFYSTAPVAIGTADPVWTVVAQHGGYNDGQSNFTGMLANLANNPFGTAYHWTDDGGVPMIANTPTGNNGCYGCFTYFIFRQTFDLTGYDPSTADLKFRWASDDVPGAVGWTPQFALNGVTLQGLGTSGAYAPGGNVILSSGFVSGLNTIDFYVEGNGQTDGFGLTTTILDSAGRPIAGGLTAQLVSGVPEPETYVLLLAGLGMLGFVARRRNRNPA